MLEKVERFLFYPVLIIATILALQSWTAQPLLISIIASVAVAILWLSPLLPKKLVPLRKIIFWIMLFLLLIGLAWIAAWAR